MTKIWALVLVMFALLWVPAGAEEVPNLVGTWTGVNSAVRLGTSDYVPELSSENVTFAEGISFTLIIEEQNGQRFVGERFPTERPEVSEDVLGVISLDNKTIYMVDEDGHLDGELISDTEMELVYREVDPDGMIISIFKYTKT